MNAYFCFMLVKLNYLDGDSLEWKGISATKTEVTWVKHTADFQEVCVFRIK